MDKNILKSKNEDTLFKCYSLGDSLENMLIINPNQVINISSCTMKKDNKSKLLITYWNNVFHIETLFICDFIVPIKE